jgi:two-component system sensor histidine kinase YesM
MKTFDFFAGRLANKMILNFSLIVVVIVIVLTYTSYYRSIVSIRQNYTASGLNDLRHSIRALDNYIEQTDILALSFRTDREIERAVLENELYENGLFLEGKLTNLIYSRLDVEKVSLFIVNNRKTIELN